MRGGAISKRLKNGRLARARPGRGIEQVRLLESIFSFICLSNFTRFAAQLSTNWAIDHDMSPMQACMALDGSLAEAPLMDSGQTTGANPWPQLSEWRDTGTGPRTEAED